MKPFSKFLFILILFPVVSYAQVGISGRIGYGSYSMKGLKGFNKSVIQYYQNEYDIKLDQLEDFPAFGNYSVEIFAQTKKSLRFSFGYSAQSTGSRAYYSDYSGSFKSDIIAHSNVYYLNVSQILIHSILDAGIYAQPQILKCKTTIETKLVLEPDVNDGEKIKCTSQNSGLELGIVLRKNIWKFEVEGQAGYYFDTNKDYFEFDYQGRNQYLEDPISGKKILNNWNGLRLSVGIGFHL
jgi:hypothetical protein